MHFRDFIPPLIGLALALAGFFLRRAAQKKASAAAADGVPAKWPKRRKTLWTVLSVIGIWIFLVNILPLIFGDLPHEELTVSIIPPRAEFSVFGYTPSTTMVVGWGVMAALIFIALLLRIFVIPRLESVPRRIQNVLEALVELAEGYSSSKTVYLGQPMFGYIFTVGAVLLGYAVAELIGFRSPSSDITFTFALSLISFVMANWYGFRQRSVRGRLKSLASPSPLLMPIRIVTDLANPVSMACRLFGNTVSGMIVMDLVYSFLGSAAVGIPSVLGLYFNVFAALVQAFIFITLTLININEATTE